MVDMLPFRNAISNVESGGNYGALGPVVPSGDRAYGRYQVMGANIPSWTEQALGVRMTPAQFVASPEAQDAVFDTIFGGYVERYGAEGAARAWFTGSPTGTGSDGYINADEYVRRFNGGGDSAPVSAQNAQNPTISGPNQPVSASPPNPFAAALAAFRPPAAQVVEMPIQRETLPLTGAAIDPAAPQARDFLLPTPETAPTSPQPLDLTGAGAPGVLGDGSASPGKDQIPRLFRLPTARPPPLGGGMRIRG